MDNVIENYWKMRLETVKEVLEKNNFDVFLAETRNDAKKIVEEKILPGINPKSISWGGSMTFQATGLYEALKTREKTEILDTYARNLGKEEMLELRRRSLLVDLFFTGTNAITETGLLVNLDNVGNRVAGITFGPRHVVILAGRNKVTADLDEAMFRVKNFAAPTNAMRLGRKTPCVKTSFCDDCSSPDRICNTWTITEKSMPKGRVKVLLINEDLGL